MMCTVCRSTDVPMARLELGYSTCLPCGEAKSREVVHTIVPMHKSNYVVITDLADLRGINNKGGLIR